MKKKRSLGVWVRKNIQKNVWPLKCVKGDWKMRKNQELMEHVDIVAQIKNEEIEMGWNTWRECSREGYPENCSSSGDRRIRGRHLALTALRTVEPSK